MRKGQSPIDTSNSSYRSIHNMGSSRPQKWFWASCRDTKIGDNDQLSLVFIGKIKYVK